MRRIYLLALCLILVYGADAQFKIKGTISDSLNYRPLGEASLVLIRVSDSVIAAHTRSAANGAFEVIVAKKGRYLLRSSFPGFADFIDTLIISKPVTEVRTVPMLSLSHLLNEVTFVQQIAAIKIKGDTTEYMADSFKVKDNATVEDLLKRLPGLQVDKNGQITAQGEVVQKILVDGEEFFSDDPKVVTQGLQANAVQKVQVFDKKSEQAEFTGIDDGQKTKTINLELKDDKKKGYFGKIDAGGGTDGYFQDQAMVNDFKNKRQLSAFGIISNTDKAGLGWADNNKYSSGNGTTEINDDGTMSTTYSSNTDQDISGWDGKYNGQGLPTTWTGGVHYANKWDEDKDHLTGNYRYALQNVELAGTTLNQDVLPGNGGFTQNQQKTQSSQGGRNGLNLMFEKKIDSFNSIKLTMDAGNKTMNTYSTYNTYSAGSDDAPLSMNNRVISSRSTGDYLNADFIIKHRFAKKGRTLSFDFKENYKDNKSDGNLLSNTNIFAWDTILRKTDTLAVPVTNQEKQANSFTQAFNGKVTYTEPISKKGYIELNYGLTLNNSTAKNYSNDNATGLLDSVFSSNYKYNILTQTGGATMRFVYEKINFSFGGNVANADWRQTNLFHNDSLTTRNFLNFFPMMVFNYKFSKQTNLYITYQGSTQQPSISQIQPLRQNNDPLNITIGNPNLKQAFVNSFSLRFNDFKILSQRFIWSNFNFSTTNNAISTAMMSQYGINTTQFINVDGNYSGSGFLGYGFRLKKHDIDLGMQGSAVLSHIHNIINGEQNLSNNNSYGLGPYISFEKEKKIELNLEGNISYNDNRSTISSFSTSYWSSNTQFSSTFQLPAKFEFGTSVDLLLRQKTVLFDHNNNVVKWNGWVGRKFLKKSQLELKASVFDILNQNLGYSRIAQNGIITENTYNTIRRYGMLNLIWNFTKNGAAMPPPPPMMLH